MGIMQLLTFLEVNRQVIYPLCKYFLNQQDKINLKIKGQVEYTDTLTPDKSSDVYKSN